VVLFLVQLTFLDYIWIQFEIVTNWSEGILSNWFDWNHHSCIGWILGCGMLFKLQITFLD
jgi:hypothetical protein